MANNNKLFEYRFKHLILPILMLASVVVAAWYLFGYYISRALLITKLTEMNLIFHFYDFIYWRDISSPSVIADLRDNPTDFGNGFGTWLYNLKYAIEQYEALYDAGAAFRIVDFTKVFWFFNGYLFPFYFLIGIAVLWWGYNKMNGALFTEKLTMDTLLEREKDLYPALHPLMNQGLVSTYGNINDQWSPPLTEYEFAERYDLLKKGRGEQNQFIDEHGNVFQRLDYLKAKEVFDRQLDYRFTGFENMQPYRKAVFALIGVMLNPSEKDEKGEKKDYKKMCMDQADKISRAFALSGNKFKIDNPDMYGEWVEEFYNKFKDLEYFKKYILCRHAYELTVFAALYSAALNIQGVMPTSYFKWLKIVDRKLYFVLNCVGRQDTDFVEVAGILTHWLIEYDTGMPHIIPKTTNAVKSLEAELRKYRQEDPSERYFHKR